MKSLKNNQLKPSVHYSSPYVTMALDHHLITEIKNLLTSSWIINDFTYPSLAAFVNTTLAAYLKNQFQLGSFNSFGKQKVNVTSNLSAEVNDFYASLPRGKKNLVIERILASYLQSLKNAQSNSSVS